MVFLVDHEGPGGPGIPFNLCIYDLSFIPKSEVSGLTNDGSYCTGPATEALIDDMSGSSISLSPPPCGTKGGWFVSSSGGTFTVPSGNSSTTSGCGSLCESLYSPLPAGFPGPTTAGDGGSSPSTQAMCIAGQTSQGQYSWSVATLEFAFSGTVPAGGPSWDKSGGSGFDTEPPPALIDASQYSGIEFWLWVSQDTVADVTSNFLVSLVDKNQLRGAGMCDPTDTASFACASSAAGVSFSAAAEGQCLGSLYGDDGSEVTTLVAGWQHVRVPWSNFLANPYYGGANETSVDPTTLAFAQFMIEQTRPDGSVIPFDFCIDGLAFFR